MFVKYDVQKELGIILLHNHFPLSPTEILVQFHNAAVPWETERNKADLKHVNTTAWRFVNDGIPPWEFTYSSPIEGAPIPSLESKRYSDFLIELYSILAKRKLLDILGLVVIEEPDIDAPATVEVEFGRLTITLDVDVDPQEDDGFIEVIWQFGTRRGKLRGILG